jgi:hypothetical protein
MKNITLAIDESILREVRKYAVERDTTVNALVRDYLSRLACQTTQRGKIGEELARMSDESEGRLGPDWTWSREATYERSILSGHYGAAVRSNGQRTRRDKKKAGS